MTRRLSGFGAYRRYLAIKYHFNSESYDYIKYQKQVKASENSYEKRKDKFVYESLAKKYSEDELENILISNFVSNDSFWIGDVKPSHYTIEVYHNFKKRLSVIKATLSNDICYLKELCDKKGYTFNDLLDTRQDLPIVYYELEQGNISPEIIVLFNEIFNFLNKRILDNIIFKRWKLKIEKYSVLLKEKKYIDDDIKIYLIKNIRSFFLTDKENSYK